MDVRLVREGGRPTELRYDVMIGQATASANYTPAIPNMDFRLSTGTQPFISSIPFLAISFLLLPDSFYEGDKAFVITSRPPTNANPQYSLPELGITFADTTVVIVDNEGKISLIEVSTESVSITDGKLIKYCIYLWPLKC